MAPSRLPFREQLYAGTWPDVALLDNLLQSEGIVTMVATNPRVRTQSAVFALNEAQLDRAREIVTRFINHEPLVDPKSYRSWRCPRCNELVEGQFAACWKCGDLRP
jgi:hypothetical protein